MISTFTELYAESALYLLRLTLLEIYSLCSLFVRTFPSFPSPIEIETLMVNEWQYLDETSVY